MNEAIHGYILGSVHEKDRLENVNFLKTQIPNLEYQEAIYPQYSKVPFIDQIREQSQARTGHKLNHGEVGCLLSHRQIWRKITASSGDNKKMFLVLESDSCIQDMEMIVKHFGSISEKFDLFFWGAWEGHMKLFRSTKNRLSDNYMVGEPFIESVYCTYGYSLNKTAASYLLKKTNRVNYPVDQFRRFIGKGDVRIGGVMPELITTIGKKKSYIQENRNSIKEFFRWMVLDARNSLICMLK